MRIPPSLAERLRNSALLSYPAALALRLYHALGPRQPMGDQRNYEAYFGHKASFQSKSPGAYRLARYAAIARLVGEGGGGSVLDVAAGDATTLIYLRDHVPSVHAMWVCDISTAAVEHAVSLGLDAFPLDLTHLDQEQLADRLGNGVDWIVATEVLEHLPDPESALSRLVQLARKGVIVSVPNTGYYPFRMQLLLGRFPRQWEVWPGEHLRYWTYRDFRWWLGQLGLRGRPTVYYGLPLLSRLWKNLFADGLVWLVTSELEQGEQG